MLDRVPYSDEVTAFLDGASHPMRAEIEALRNILLCTQEGIGENVKWNGPNYTFAGNDRITMRIFPPKQIQLIFHRGAKKQVQPAEHLIATDSALLAWRENDRAIATFKNMAEIERNASELSEIIRAWVKVQ